MPQNKPSPHPHPPLAEFHHQPIPHRLHPSEFAPGPLPPDQKGGQGDQLAICE